LAGVRVAHAGTVTFDLHGVRADSLLIWITRTGDDGRVVVSEVDLRGR
jgi:hypothetical protein